MGDGACGRRHPGVEINIELLVEEVHTEGGISHSLPVVTHPREFALGRLYTLVVILAQREMKLNFRI